MIMSITLSIMRIFHSKCLFLLVVICSVVITSIILYTKSTINPLRTRLMIRLVEEESPQEINFDTDLSGNNETGFPFLIVPDIVHYVRLSDPFLDFITYLSIKSVLTQHKPRNIYIHVDNKEEPRLRGKYWSILNHSYSHVIQVKSITKPSLIYGKKLSSIYHSSDIARLEILIKYGGIFLDNDVLIIKPLHEFRVFEMTLGWPEDEFLGTQVLIAHKDARFLRLWKESYKEYRPTRWYYNAGELPTKRFLIPRPELIHRVTHSFGVHNCVPLLYSQLYPFWRTEFHAIHLLARHREYLVPLEYERYKYFNENNIKRYNRTFGQMARWILYGTIHLIRD